tara:strand:- start:121 stop:246 length:126 start_codon:yes stop_codon:yes gene_type:complete
MIIKIKDYQKNKFPKHRVGEYRCPVVIWNQKGRRLFYERNQ